MAIVRTGTAITINTATAESSQSITVPSDAQIAVAFLGAYSNLGGVTIPNPCLTLAGTGLTRLVATGVLGAYSQASLEYVVTPPTGSQTLAWNFTSWLLGSGDGGCHIVIAFYKGINTSSPIVDSDGGQNLGSITGLTYTTGDMMVGGVTSDGTGIDVTASSQTQIHESAVDAISSVFVLAVAEKLSTGTFDYTGESAPGAVACILAQSTAVSIDQLAFRARNDDGTEATATWKETQGTDLTTVSDAAARWRFLLQAVGDPESIGAQLEYRYKPFGGGFGSWTKANLLG